MNVENQETSSQSRPACNSDQHKEGADGGKIESLEQELEPF